MRVIDKRFFPNLAAAGGTYLIRGGEVKVLERDWRPNRMVVVRFDSADEARRMPSKLPPQESCSSLPNAAASPSVRHSPDYSTSSTDEVLASMTRSLISWARGDFNALSFVL
jgi:uncharacterized protein (DUF1330 family)